MEAVRNANFSKPHENWLSFHAAKVGQPYQWALEEQKRLIKEKAEAAKASLESRLGMQRRGDALELRSTCAGEGRLLHKWPARSEGQTAGDWC